jgi:hypothetical protein
MPRLKKKNIQAAPVVPVVSVENFGVTMTFRQAAKHYGVKISSIRNTVKDYGLDAPRMGKYKIVRLTDLEVVLAKKAVCDKLNADPLFRELPPANRWRWEPERKKWGPSTTSVMGAMARGATRLTALEFSLWATSASPNSNRSHLVQIA